MVVVTDVSGSVVALHPWPVTTVGVEKVGSAHEIVDEASELSPGTSSTTMVWAVLAEFPQASFAVQCRTVV